MDDETLAEYLNIPVNLVSKIKPDKRAVYERMADVEFEVKLWQDGIGEKPKGVILCGQKELRPYNK